MARRFVSIFIANCAFAAVVAIAGSWTDSAFVRIATAAELTPATSANASLTPSGAPKRKAGWWEFRSGVETSGPSDEQLCVGERSETVFSAFDQLAPKDWCTVRDFHRDGDGWTFRTVCEYGVGEYTSGPVTATGTITGNLTTSYVIRQTVTGKKTGTRKGTLSAQWAGQCPKGKKDGDRVIDGYKMNVLKGGLF